MGVKLLTTFVKHNNTKLVKDTEWSPKQKGPNIIVDGNAINYHAYKIEVGSLDPTFGGQMDDFSVAARKFLKSLQMCVESVTFVCENENNKPLPTLLSNGASSLTEFSSFGNLFSHIISTFSSTSSLYYIINFNG